MVLRRRRPSRRRPQSHHRHNYLLRRADFIARIPHHRPRWQHLVYRAGRGHPGPDRSFAQLSPTVSIFRQWHFHQCGWRSCRYSGPAATFTSNLPGATPSSFHRVHQLGRWQYQRRNNFFRAASGGTTFTVSGTNTYLTPGTAYHPVVTISSASAPGTRHRHQYPQSSPAPSSPPATPYHMSRSQRLTAVLATFVGPVPASGYTATINWGDGSTSARHHRGHQRRLPESSARIRRTPLRVITPQMS